MSEACLEFTLALKDDWSPHSKIDNSAWCEESWRDFFTPVFSPLSTRALSTENRILERFLGLARLWREETRFTSRFSDLILNRNYQQIIGLGRPVVPIIIGELGKQTDHWFWALSAITGETPVPEEHAGDLDAMRLDWLNWADKNGVKSYLT